MVTHTLEYECSELCLCSATRTREILLITFFAQVSLSPCKSIVLYIHLPFEIHPDSSLLKALLIFLLDLQVFHPCSDKALEDLL